VLGDPAFKGDEQVGPRRQAVRRVTDELIDWDEMGRRTLGAHWQTLGENERRAFVALFSELLNRAYLRNLDRYEGEKIVVTGDSVDGDRAVVQAKSSGTTARACPSTLRWCVMASAGGCGTSG